MRKKWKRKKMGTRRRRKRIRKMIKSQKSLCKYAVGNR